MLYQIKLKNKIKLTSIHHLVIKINNKMNEINKIENMFYKKYRL